LRSNRWIGRHYVDVPGQVSRRRLAVVLGLKHELTKPEAKLKLLSIITTEGINTAGHLERSLEPVKTFNDVADVWKSKRLPQLKESTRYVAPKLVAKYLRPFFGQMAVAKIRSGTVNDWIADLQSKGLEPKTVHNLWKLFRAMMNWQPRKWYPVLPAIAQNEQRWLTQAEIGQIVSAAKGQYKVLFHFAAATGLRAGELFGRHVEDIDLKRRMIHVRRSVWRGQEVSPKTVRGYRDVWIDSATANVLQTHLGERTTGRVFQTRYGTPLSDHDVLQSVLYPIFDELKIKRGGMHAFRHSRINHLQQNGAPPDFTRRQVGHSSLRTTSGYTHFDEAYAREVVEKLAPKLGEGLTDEVGLTCG
jgi:integrase